MQKSVVCVLALAALILLARADQASIFAEIAAIPQWQALNNWSPENATDVCSDTLPWEGITCDTNRVEVQKMCVDAKKK